jgi:hypothetical protein
MAIKILQLLDLPSYSYTVALNSKSYKLTFVFNSRSQKYFMSIADENVTPIIDGVALLPDTEIDISDISDLKGRFLLFAISDSVDTYPSKMQDNYILMFTEG